MMETYNVAAFGATSAESPLGPLTIPRRELQPTDVEVEILYCGVCHTDLHMTKNHLGYSSYPMVPGHEITGRVTRIGSGVTKFKAGDYAAIGPISDSCGHCINCQHHQEVYCLNGVTATYGSPDKYLPGKPAYGGYSQKIVTNQDFTFKVPDNLDLAGVAPVLCAGITVWTPLKQYQVTKGSKVAVVGLGGLGHMAIKFAKAMGAEVALFSRTPAKTDDALALGADRVIISTDEQQMKEATLQFDLIIDTVPYNHDVNPFVNTLAIGGTLILVGYLGELQPGINPTLLVYRRSVSASYGGGSDSQEMLDFCGEHNIVSDIEMIHMGEINNAFERLEKGDVKYRFVIDMATLEPVTI